MITLRFMQRGALSLCVAVHICVRACLFSRTLDHVYSPRRGPTSEWPNAKKLLNAHMPWQLTHSLSQHFFTFMFFILSQVPLIFAGVTGSTIFSKQRPWGSFSPNHTPPQPHPYNFIFNAPTNHRWLHTLKYILIKSSLKIELSVRRLGLTEKFSSKLK